MSQPYQSPGSRACCWRSSGTEPRPPRDWAPRRAMRATPRLARDRQGANNHQGRTQNIIMEYVLPSPSPPRFKEHHYQDWQPQHGEQHTLTVHTSHCSELHQFYTMDLRMYFTNFNNKEINGNTKTRTVCNKKIKTNECTVETKMKMRSDCNIIE